MKCLSSMKQGGKKELKKKEQLQIKRSVKMDSKLEKWEKYKKRLLG